jgi:hypothetical protein
MRPLAGITLVVGAMSLTSCGKTQPQSLVEPATQVTGQDAAASDSSISSHTTTDIDRGDMVTDSESADSTCCCGTTCRCSADPTPKDTLEMSIDDAQSETAVAA